MAMNPMQRRTRNSFLLGFLVSLAIMFLVVVFLLYRIKGLNEAKEALEAAQSMKYVATQDLKSGQQITEEDFSTYFKMETVISDIPNDEIFSADDFQYYDEVTGKEYTKIDDEGNPIYKVLQCRLDIPAGSIVTKNMVEEIDNPTTSDVRIQEYTSISLPAYLEKGEFIDIRYAIPDGQDYVVLSKKQVIDCDVNSIWLNLTEDEMLTMNSAIVETFRSNGGIKLYAVQYVEPGMQTAAIPTYPVKEEVKELIRRDPNVVEEAKMAIEERYTKLGQIYERMEHIQKYLDDTPDEQADSVGAGWSADAQVRQSQREDYLSGSN